MSLAGLDSQALVEAFQAVEAQKDSWLLLHYPSKDALEVLSSGAKGLPELQDAVAGYTKPSPLYGYLHTRQKKLFLMYSPIGTSRLLQARTTVHLQLILDRLSPHDGVLSATIPEHINQSAVDSALDLLPEGSATPVEAPSKHTPSDDANAIAAKQNVEAEEAQSANPEVMNILARLRAEKVHSQTQSQYADPRGPSIDSTRLSSSGASGRGIIVDPYLAQLPPAKSPERPGYKSKASSERASLRSQGMLSVSKHDDLDMIDYGYGMLEPKIKHTAKPATGKKVQKTIAASQVRQKLPAGMRIGASRTNSRTGSKSSDGAKGPRGHGSSHSAIEEWRQKSATSETRALSQPEDVEEKAKQEPLQRDSKEYEQIKIEVVKPSRENSRVSRTQSTKAQTKRTESEKASDQVETKVIHPSKSHDVLRSEVQNGRPTYTSYDNRTMLTPEKQRLMKALAMRRQHLSRRTTLDSQSQVHLQAPIEIVEDQKQTKKVDSGNGHDVFDLQRNAAPNDALSPTGQTQAQPRTRSGELGLPFVPARSPLTVQGLEYGVMPAGEDDDAGQTQHEDAETDTHDKPQHLSIGRLTLGKRRPSSRRSSPRVLSRRTSDGLTPGSDGLYDGPSPSESLLEELHHATVHEARRVSTVPRSPPTFVATDLVNASPVPTPLPLSNVASPASTHDEVKSSPVDSILTGYPFPRALATVHEASTSAPSQNASTIKLSRVDEGDAESSEHHIPTALERPRTRKGKTLSQLSISHTTQDSAEDYAFGTFLNLSPTASRESMSTLPEMTSHNPRGNSRLPEIHPNHRRAEPVNISPKQPVNRRSNTLTLSSRFLETSPVKRTTSLFSRNRYTSARYQPQSTNDLMTPTQTQDSSPIKTHFTTNNPRSSFSSLHSQVQQLTPHDTNRDSVGTTYSRRDSIQSSHLGGAGRRASQISIATSTENDDERKTKRGSWAKRTFKRMSGLSTTSRASLTRLGEQCDQDPPQIAKMPTSVHAATPTAPIPVSEHAIRSKRPMQHVQQQQQQQQQGPMVIGELNVQLPDSLLWKRRWVELDTTHTLIVSAMTIQERIKTPPKRWHMTSFKLPFAAAADVEEAPYSVVMELLDGGRVQFACEDRESRGAVLDCLVGAFYASSGVGGR